MSAVGDGRTPLEVARQFNAAVGRAFTGEPTAAPVPDVREAVAAALFDTYGQHDQERSLRIADAVLAVPAIATALGDLATVRAEAAAAELLEAAELVVGCEHVTAWTWCGICDQWRSALISRADRLRAALAAQPTDADQ